MKGFRIYQTVQTGNQGGQNSTSRQQDQSGFLSFLFFFLVETFQERRDTNPAPTPPAGFKIPAGKCSTRTAATGWAVCKSCANGISQPYHTSTRTSLQWGRDEHHPATNRDACRRFLFFSRRPSFNDFLLAGFHHSSLADIRQEQT